MNRKIVKLTSYRVEGSSAAANDHQRQMLVREYGKHGYDVFFAKPDRVRDAIKSVWDCEKGVRA